MKYYGKDNVLPKTVMN